MILEDSAMLVVNGISCLLNISSCLVFHAFTLREELTQKTVAVFICASFPRRIRMSKVDLAILNFCHIRKLRTVVKSKRYDNMLYQQEQAKATKEAK